MTQALFIEGSRAGYHPEQVRNTMTVGDLIRFLEDFNEDTEVYIRNDNGYTYGGIWENLILEGEYDDDGVEIY